MPRPALCQPCPGDCPPAGCAPPSRDLILTLFWYDPLPFDGPPYTECRRRVLKIPMRFHALAPGYSVDYTGPDHGPFTFYGQPEGYSTADGRLWYSDLTTLSAADGYRHLIDLIGTYPQAVPEGGTPEPCELKGWRFVFNGERLIGVQYLDSPAASNSAPPDLPYIGFCTTDGYDWGNGSTPRGFTRGHVEESGTASANFGRWFNESCVTTPFLDVFRGVGPIAEPGAGTVTLDSSTCPGIEAASGPPIVAGVRWFDALILSELDIPDGDCPVCFSARCCADDCPEATVTVYPSHDGSNTGTPIAIGTIPAGGTLCLALPIPPEASERRHDVVVSATGFHDAGRTIAFSLDDCLEHVLYSFDLVDSTYTPTFYVYGAKPTCPVEGALVEWATENGSVSDTTDADGLVSFPDTGTPPANTTGTLTITPPTGCGWDTYVESFTLSPEYLCDPNRIDRQLPPAISYTYAGGVCTRPLKTVTTLTDGNGTVADLTYFGFDAGTSTALWTACGSYTGGSQFGPVTCGDDSKSYASSLDDVPVGYTLQITGSCDSGPPTWLVTKQAWKTNASCTGDVSKLVGRVWKLPLGIILDIACSDGLVTAPAGSDSSTELAEAEASGTFDCSCGATTTGTPIGVGVGSPPDAFLGDVSFDL